MEGRAAVPEGRNPGQPDGFSRDAQTFFPTKRPKILLRESFAVTMVNYVRLDRFQIVGSSRVDLQACKLEYSIVSPK